MTLRIIHFYIFQFYYNFDILFSYSNMQQPTKLSVPFSPLMYCLNTKLTIDSLLFAFLQDEKLKRLVEIHGSVEWKALSQFFPDRSDVQCQHRWQKVLNPELIKGPWTKEVRTLSILLFFFI